MNQTSVFYLAALFLLCFACNNKKGEKPVAGIEYQSKVFKVSKAYLSVNGKDPVPPDFRARVGEKVYLQIEVDKSGWTSEEGRIYPGVYQKVESSDKKHVFVQEDLMESHPEGVPADDGWLITVMAVVNAVDRPYDHFMVHFRVWDKRGKGEITGSYKLFLQK
jgi:hypothetical protein